ncbi:MAG: PAC2 family protein [Chloroflexi bacterium]|nr:PAC2 family protein [Chloroflexota bacterium]
MRVGDFEVQEPLPSLKEPHAIAMLSPWVDAGKVGTLTLSRLEDHFGARELGRLAKPGAYYDFTRYRPITRLVEGQRSLSVPNTVIYYAHREEPPDFLFCHVLEPHAFAEDYVASLTQLFKTLGVKRHCRIGAMYNSVPHTRPLRVTGTLAGEPLSGFPGLVTRQRSNYEGPTSILGLFSQELDRLGVENMTLMVHLPHYLQLEEDFAGTARILEVLRALYHLPGSIPQTELGQRQYRELNSEVMRNPSAKALVERLEEYYDTGPEAQEAEAPSPLPEDMQKFLEDLSKKLDNP